MNTALETATDGSRGDNTSVNNAPVLACHRLAKIFDQGELRVEVFTDVNLAILPAERVAIVGRSGAGKSTLLHLLGGLDVPTRGEVIVAGQDMSHLNETRRGVLRNKTLGFVYQFHHLLPEFTTLENVSMPLLIRGQSHAAAGEQAMQILEKVGLGHRLAHKPGQLSGGERQRAAVARALVTRPQCLLADEPTGNLDKKTAEHVYELMLELNNEMNTSLVVVTHDQELAARMDRVLSLEEGRLSGI